MKLIGAILVLFALAPSFARADSYFVENATGPGVAESDLATVTELVRGAIAGIPGESAASSREKADFTLRPKLLKLGAALIMTLDKLSGQKVVYSGQLKAAKIDELDVVARRLTRSVITQTEPKADARVSEVTDQETRDGSNRRPARKGSFLGLGPAVLGNVKSSGIGYDLVGGYAWDINTLMIKIIGDIAAEGDATFGSVGLGGSYFLSDRDTTPYLGLDVGYGGAHVHDDNSVFAGESRGGFVLGAGAGLQFLRTSSINIEIGARIATLLSSNSIGMPVATSLRLAFYF